MAYARTSRMLVALFPAGPALVALQAHPAVRGPGALAARSATGPHTGHVPLGPPTPLSLKVAVGASPPETSRGVRNRLAGLRDLTSSCIHTFHHVIRDMAFPFSLGIDWGPNGPSRVSGGSPPPRARPCHVRGHSSSGGRGSR